MPSLRLQRVRELLKRAIGEVIRREIPPGDAGLITVNDVDVSGDLKSATVYIGILGNAQQQKKGLSELERYRVRIQGLVAKAVILKYMPKLQFKIDDSVEQGNKVLKIIDELERAGLANETSSENH
jgi:ribosome-binding factor A